MYYSLYALILHFFTPSFSSQFKKNASRAINAGVSCKVSRDYRILMIAINRVFANECMMKQKRMDKRGGKGSPKMSRWNNRRMSAIYEICYLLVKLITHFWASFSVVIYFKLLYIMVRVYKILQILFEKKVFLKILH